MKQTEEQKQLTKSSLKIFFLTLVGLGLASLIVVLALPFISPKTGVAMYRTFGSEKGMIASQELVYERSGKIEDLYNLVYMADKYQDNSRILAFAPKMFNHKDYVAFAEAFDKKALETIEKDKQYAVCSLTDYLCRLQVDAKYRKKAKDVKEFAASSFEKDALKISYYEEYINCVVSNKKLSNEKKQTAIKEFAETMLGGKTVLEMCEERFLKFMPESLQDASLLEIELLWQTENTYKTMLIAVGETDFSVVDARLLQLGNEISARLA